MSNITGAFSYTYDAAGRQITEYAPTVNITLTSTLYATGVLNNLDYGGLGYTTTLERDDLDRITAICEGPNCNTFGLSTYRYDELGERNFETIGGNVVWLSYTPSSRLSGLSENFNGSSVGISYTYNKDHQISAVTVTDGTYLPQALNTGTTDYSANSINQYSTVGGTTYTYDVANLASDGTWTYTYDAENHLTQASKTGTTINYYYDFRGRRYAKSVNGTMTYFLSSGDQEVAEINGSGTLINLYVYGPDLDEPLLTYNSNGHFYHFRDAVGSVIALADSTGAVSEQHSYTAYGKSMSSGTTAFQFASRRLDPETGLYYNRARMYSPVIGRFLQTDPIGTAGGVNLYAYALNDPVNKLDPTGNVAQIIQDGNNVTIVMPMQFFGATDAQIAAYKQAIESTWSGTIGDYNVTTTVVDPGPNTPADQVNVVTVVPSMTNVPSPTPSPGLTDSIGGNQVTISGPDTDAYPGIVAHEAGHLLGAGDHYTNSQDASGNIVSTPDPGYQGDIMASDTGKASGTDIDEILHNDTPDTFGTAPDLGSEEGGSDGGGNYQDFLEAPALPTAPVWLGPPPGSRPSGGK